MYMGIQCLIACVIFTILVLPAQYKDPMKYIMSYPPRIRKRVEGLPQYKGVILEKEKRHITVKITVVFLSAIILALVAFFSGARGFKSASIHVFILFFCVNMYDMIVLDLCIFCHSKKLRIPGTEDMDREYKSPWHHVKGAVKGLIIGIFVAVVSGGIVYVASLFI